MNKFNKGKLIGIVAASLSAVSLMGVGFASWIVSGTIGDTTGNITVSVADVQDQRVSITDASVSTTNSSISFDAKGSGKYLKPSNGATEDLTFEITFNLKVAKNASFAGIKAYVTGTELLSAVNSNYVTLPTGVYETQEIMNSSTSTTYMLSSTDLPSESTTDSDGFTVYAITKELSMGWGSVFGNSNPANLNDETQLKTYIDNLKALKMLNINAFTLYLMPFTTGA